MISNTDTEPSYLILVTTRAPRRRKLVLSRFSLRNEESDREQASRPQLAGLCHEEDVAHSLHLRLVALRLCSLRPCGRLACHPCRLQRCGLQVRRRLAMRL